MSRHLEAQDFVDALDLALTPARQQHLDTCARCQTELEEFRQIAAEVKDIPASDPSPLYWNHFTNRVLERTAASEPAPGGWWSLAWRPVAAAACLVVALLVAQRLPARLLNSETRVRTDGAVSLSGSTFDVGAPAADDESLAFVARVASGASLEDLQEAAEPTTDATDAVVEQLTPEQRAELKRLLTASLSGTR
jgi:hypothetical protein